MADAMERAQVLDFELQKQLVPLMRDLTPLPGIYDASFIAANQAGRADNLISGTKAEQLEAIRGHIRAFKAENQVCSRRSRPAGGASPKGAGATPILAATRNEAPGSLRCAARVALRSPSPA